ncbi:peptidoglycan D,D-transpeptidase FtsI family protein [Aureimonas altamirensis]|jgi:cell division protein FtsI (penicillin-binding protein 3)|uniref:Cell division protein FtsI (Penicillin-binding protein 3) n=1 Tax=Aureimonas altamirensis DSM 21988 TaxID=1121026 RepID=A0ABY1IGJ3_9HYPH|nr:penicillin-binding protein 2 [Aureimonas altamirensis]SHJ14193.1 cell division protein FtsI (penicillin-binding protein 3) [Aureimonas altamirensis DSM 21988]
MPQNRMESGKSRVRVNLVLGIFIAAHVAIVARLVDFAYSEPAVPNYGIAAPSTARPDILDRNGNILARDLATFSVYAEPRRIVDADEAVEKLLTAMPDLNAKSLYQRLSGKSGFTWIKRSINPAKQQEILNLGIPGIGFREEVKRLYPNGPAAAQVLGAVNVDNVGIAGIEKWIDTSGLGVLRTTGMRYERADLDPVQLSIDLYVQHAFTDQLAKEIEKYEAVGGAGLLMDVTNGEVLSLVSLPDFDPNDPTQALKKENINRINVGVYEMGSTFKALTTAMAIDSGQFNLRSVIDASKPLSFGRFAIRDYRGEYRPLNLPEAFLVSSNIAFGKMALAVGVEKHKAFLAKMGETTRLTTELPESAAPIVPKRWTEVNTATIAFGHGLAVTPLQAATGVAGLVNGGHLIRPTFIKDTPVADRMIADNVVAPETSETLRYLMRLNAVMGSAKRANVPGYFIGGKTGTAEKVVNGRYDKSRVMTSFMGVLPANNPKYLMLVILDEPKGSKETYGFRTSGWNAVPAGGRIFERILPLLHLAPVFDNPPDPFPVATRQNAYGYQNVLPQSAGR